MRRPRHRPVHAQWSANGPWACFVSAQGPVLRVQPEAGWGRAELLGVSGSIWQRVDGQWQQLKARQMPEQEPGQLRWYLSEPELFSELLAERPLQLKWRGPPMGELHVPGGRGFSAAWEEIARNPGGGSMRVRQKRGVEKG